MITIFAIPIITIINIIIPGVGDQVFKIRGRKRWTDEKEDDQVLEVCDTNSCPSESSHKWQN